MASNFFAQEMARNRLTRPESRRPLISGPGVTSNFDGSRVRVDPPEQPRATDNVAAPTIYPWQLSRAPKPATGTDPYAATRAWRVQVELATVNGRPADNHTDEFVCFTGTGTVYTTFYAKMYFSIDPFGILSLTSWTIEIVNGLTMPTAPGFVGGAPPAYVQESFATATVVDGVIAKMRSRYFTSASLKAILVDASNPEAQVRDVIFVAGANF